MRGSAAGESPWSIRVGALAGIPIRIHLTFFLLLLWFGNVSRDQGQGFIGGVLFMLLLFGCVVLHELGHALAARRYGVATHEIVLYPFGGVARIDRMPSGRAELVIALAGPAVNLVLAGLLTTVILLWRSQAPESAKDIIGGAPIVWQLLWANLTLFAFNLIPAFPMDGGRVLRATLSIFLGEARATNIAAGVGQAIALAFAVLAFLPPPIKPVLLLIAFFVFVGAGQEAAFQRSRSAVRGLAARDAMITRFETLAPQDPLSRAVEHLLASNQQDFPVVDSWGRVVGVLHRSALLAALAADGKESAVLEVMDREPAIVPPDQPLERVLRQLQAQPMQPVLVVGDAGLEGVITVDNLAELLEIARTLGSTATVRIRS
ncbi:MAG: site-2 protease family protein [Thermoanaerobaculia bacterium]|nr:MAG: site-2 protease family protein [Thermoanaerobaculia bacterium]MBZ0103596.1 site-2 protease family protein [Thermoanaerobaculia bacterium]